MNHLGIRGCWRNRRIILERFTKIGKTIGMYDSIAYVGAWVLLLGGIVCASADYFCRRLIRR